MKKIMILILATFSLSIFGKDHNCDLRNEDTRILLRVIELGHSGQLENYQAGTIAAAIKGVQTGFRRGSTQEQICQTIEQGLKNIEETLDDLTK